MFLLFNIILILYSILNLILYLCVIRLNFKHTAQINLKNYSIKIIMRLIYIQKVNFDSI